MGLGTDITTLNHDFSLPDFVNMAAGKYTDFDHGIRQIRGKEGEVVSVGKYFLPSHLPITSVI